MEGNKVKVKIINIKKEKNYLKNSLATMILFMSSQVLQFILVLDVLRETGSALIFSVAVAASSIFNIVFSPISGFINEKYDKRYIMGISVSCRIFRHNNLFFVQFNGNNFNYSACRFACWPWNF